MNAIYRCNTEGCPEKGQESIGPEPSPERGIPRRYGCRDYLERLRGGGESPIIVGEPRTPKDVSETLDPSLGSSSLSTGLGSVPRRLTKSGPGSKGETLEWMRTLLRSEPHAVNALLLISSYQTPLELSLQQSDIKNGVGFTKFDAEILTSFAKQYRNRGFLSVKQLSVLTRRMPKYAGQMVKIGYGPDGMKQVCASCQTLLREGKLDSQGRHSHGCCGQCAKKVRDSL